VCGQEEKGIMAMRYLGALRGEGTLCIGAESQPQVLGPAEYDLDGYLVPPGGVAASGELRSAPEILRKVFGRRDLRLVTADGRSLGFRFTEKKLGGDGDAAHIDLTAGLPTAKEWSARKRAA
jgi:hypothetical protein